MDIFGTKKKIEEVKSKIVRELSAKTNTAYILPYNFFGPKKKKGSVYTLETDVIKLGDVFYPIDIFPGYGDFKGDAVLYLDSAYESLGSCYSLPDGEWVFGIRCNGVNCNDLESLYRRMVFDVDIKTGTYTMTESSMFKEESQKTNESQKGE